MIDHAILFGILFTLVCWTLSLTLEVWRQDITLIAADELKRQDAERIANLTVALEDADARADQYEQRGESLEAHGAELYRRVIDARRERDDALGKLGVLGALVREAARNGRELN